MIASGEKGDKGEGAGAIRRPYSGPTESSQNSKVMSRTDDYHWLLRYEPNHSNSQIQVTIPIISLPDNSALH
jgi:hypothetical protein